MSTFEPMTEDALQEIAGNCATETSVLARVVATAIHYLARVRELEERVDRPGNLGEILGWTGEESMASAAVRVVGERDVAMREWGMALKRAEVLENARDADVAAVLDARAILGARPDDLLSDAAKRAARTSDLAASAVQILSAVLPHGVDYGIEALAKMAADELAGAPAQTFRPPISVTVSSAGGMTYAEIEVGDITDPAFLALPMSVRLGLVVLRD